MGETKIIEFSFVVVSSEIHFKLFSCFWRKKLAKYFQTCQVLHGKNIFENKTDCSLDFLALMRNQTLRSNVRCTWWHVFQDSNRRRWSVKRNSVLYDHFLHSFKISCDAFAQIFKILAEARQTFSVMVFGVNQVVVLVSPSYLPIY